MSVNKWIGLGNLGRDPEVRTTTAGKKVASFSLACSEKWRDQNGVYQESTEWVNVTFWGRQAEICEQYLKKGKQVFVEGKIKTDSWDDPNGGGKRYKTYILGISMQMIGGASGNNGSQSNSSGNNGNSSPQGSQGFGMDDELPF
jgi:single-strand DNA-binding protein